MRWPWTRPDEDQRRELQKTEYTRASMHALITRLEVAVNRLEEITEEADEQRQT